MHPEQTDRPHLAVETQRGDLLPFLQGVFGPHSPHLRACSGTDMTWLASPECTPVSQQSGVSLDPADQSWACPPPDTVQSAPRVPRLS